MKPFFEGPVLVGWGALLGMIGVILGAFGSHAFEDKLTPENLESFETAVRYHLFHAILLIILGTSDMDFPWTLSATFLIGILLFAGSIYTLVLVDWKMFPTLKTPVAILTPVGGSTLIIAWGWLSYWGFTTVSS